MQCSQYLGGTCWACCIRGMRRAPSLLRRSVHTHPIRGIHSALEVVCCTHSNRGMCNAHIVLESWAAPISEGVGAACPLSSPNKAGICGPYNSGTCMPKDTGHSSHAPYRVGAHTHLKDTGLLRTPLIQYLCCAHPLLSRCTSASRHRAHCAWPLVSRCTPASKQLVGRSSYLSHLCPSVFQTPFLTSLPSMTVPQPASPYKYYRTNLLTISPCHAHFFGYITAAFISPFLLPRFACYTQWLYLGISSSFFSCVQHL